MRREILPNQTPVPPAAPIEPSDVSLQRRTLDNDLTGTIIDNRYEVLCLLGQGGMGAVYKAHHRKLDRDVALKQLYPHLVRNKQVVERFLQEARTESALKHVNILNVQSLIVTEDGCIFLVMEFLEGETLEALIERETKLSPQSARAIFLQICEGLGYAHESGVVHRDLKPSNIMLVDGGKTVKIVDFGIAKLILAGESNAQHMTRTGAIVGSPHYMSPEQCAGGAVDPRSDIYSFGCLMYEVLTGQVPFDGNPLEIMAKRLSQAPVPPHRIVPDLPPDLETIIQKAMEVAPANRYQSLQELQMDLARAQLDRAKSPNITGRVETQSPTRAAPKTVRRKVVARAVFAVLAILLAGFAFTPWGRIVQLRARLAMENSNLQKTVLLHNLSDEYTKIGDRNSAIKYTTEEVALLERVYGENNYAYFLSHVHLADLYWMNQDQAQAGTIYAASLKGLSNLVSVVLVHDPDLRQSAMRVIERARQVDSLSTTVPLLSAGHAFEQFNDPQLSAACYSRAASAAEQRSNYKTECDALGFWARLSEKTHDLPQAEKLFAEKIAIEERQDTRHRAPWTSYKCLADCLSSERKNEEAQTYYRKASAARDAD